MHQFFQLQAVFGFTVALFEVPTGYLSDRFGRKKSLCTGGFLAGISYLILTQATGFWGLLAHEFSLGLALSFVSGTDIALLYESLPKKSPRDVSSRILGHNQMASALGESSAAVLCTILLIFFSYYEIIFLQALVAWAPFLVALTLKEPKEHQHTTLEISKIKILWRQILHDYRITRLLAFNFVLWMLATFIAVWIIQRYWQDQNIPVQWFGLLWAGSNMVIGLTGLYARQLEARWGIQNILLVIAGLCLAAYFFMPLFGGFLGVLFGTLIYIARGLNTIVSRDLLNQTMEPELRATANSILNFLFRIIFAIVGPAIGFSIDRWGLDAILYAISGIFLVCFAFITLPLCRSLTSEKPWETVTLE
jgi:MFS family permease